MEGDTLTVPTAFTSPQLRHPMAKIPHVLFLFRWLKWASDCHGRIGSERRMVVKGLPRVGRLWDLSSEGVAVTGQMEVRLPGTQGPGCLPASMVGASTFMTPICPGLGWLASDKVSLSPESSMSIGPSL